VRLSRRWSLTACSGGFTVSLHPQVHLPYDTPGLKTKAKIARLRPSLSGIGKKLLNMRRSRCGIPQVTHWLCCCNNRTTVLRAGFHA
jgi:hypothetical protein